MENFYNKTVLVTGATGLIGSHIIDALMKLEGVRVIALSRNENKLKEGFKEYIERDRFSYISADVTQDFAGLLGKESEIDYIFHAASPMEGKIIQNYPVDVIKPNLNGAINCLEFLRKQTINKNVNGRLVLFSSVTVYSNNTDNDKTVLENDTDVTDFLESKSAPYSQSKRMSEVIAQAYIKQYGCDVVIARLSTVYGNTRFRPDTAFFQFIDTALAHRDIVMNTAGIGRRDNIYIDDAVNGLLKICIDGKKGEAYNVSSNGDGGNYAAVDEVGQMIINDINKRNEGKKTKINLVYKQSFEGERKPGLKLDNTKLKKLGWNIKMTLKDGIHETINAILN